MPSVFGSAKDAANRKTHEVSLAEGDGVFYDPLAFTAEDSSSQGEQRFVSIGVDVFRTTGGRLYISQRRRTDRFRAKGPIEGSPRL